MTQPNYDGQPRQVVRTLAPGESIPNLCTACLLESDVRPLYSFIPEAGCNQKQSNERFAPKEPKELKSTRAILAKHQKGTDRGQE